MDDCYRALSISKDEDLKMPLKKQPNFCFVNNYFDAGLTYWQPNMDTKFVYGHIFPDVYFVNTNLPEEKV